VEKHTCQRCRCQEYIPTHQFVKFDERVQYVCAKCWEAFRKWFFVGTRANSGGDAAA
jgi:hypothetical protein